MFFGHEAVAALSVGQVFLLCGGIDRSSQLHLGAAARFIPAFGLPVLGLGGCLVAPVAVHGPLKFATGLVVFFLCEEQFAAHEAGPSADMLARQVGGFFIVGQRRVRLAHVLSSPAQLV